VSSGGAFVRFIVRTRSATGLALIPVLVAAGLAAPGEAASIPRAASASAAALDLPPSIPETGEWSTGPDMHVLRGGGTALTLPDGRVLILGGDESGTTTDIFSPGLETMTTGPSFAIPQFGATTTLLENGGVLIVGGGDLAVAEVLDPALIEWTVTNPPAEARSGHTATRLNDGRVLVVGGFNSGGVL